MEICPVNIARCKNRLNHARWIWLALLPLATACTPQTYLTIRSEPPGAMVFEGSQERGRTPVTLNYTAATSEAGNGCVATRPINVHWDTGAHAKVSTIKVCEAPTGQTTYTFVYPEGYTAQDQAPDLASHDRGVNANGQMFYQVPAPGGESTLKCFSNMSGDQVVTQCGG